MRATWAIALGVLLVIVALVARAPARLLDAPLARATSGRVHLADATGTVWNGRADLVVPTASAPLPFQWHIEALPLLGGEVRGTLQSGAASVPSVFALNRREASVHDLALAAPASMLVALVPAAAALATVSGRLELRAPVLDWRTDTLDGNATLHWRDAAIRVDALGQNFALGDVEIHAQGDGGRLNGVIVNTGGDLALAGTASIGPDGRARLDLSARPREGLDPDRAQALATALRNVASVDASGTARVLLQ